MTLHQMFWWRCRECTQSGLEGAFDAGLTGARAPARYAGADSRRGVNPVRKPPQPLGLTSTWNLKRLGAGADVFADAGLQVSSSLSCAGRGQHLSYYQVHRISLGAHPCCTLNLVAVTNLDIWGDLFAGCSACQKHDVFCTWPCSMKIHGNDRRCAAGTGS